MTLILFFKTCVIWLAIAMLAIVNGIVRENVLIPWLGRKFALPLSGVLLALIVFIVTLIFFDWFGRLKQSGYWLIGGQWLLMTLAFEFLFGHFVAGKSWAEIVSIFNPLTGDLFTLVLLASLLSPWLVSIIKGT